MSSLDATGVGQGQKGKGLGTDERLNIEGLLRSFRESSSGSAPVVRGRSNSEGSGGDVPPAPKGRSALDRSPPRDASPLAERQSMEQKLFDILESVSPDLLIEMREARDRVRARETRARETRARETRRADSESTAEYGTDDGFIGHTASRGSRSGVFRYALSGCLAAFTEEQVVQTAGAERLRVLFSGSRPNPSDVSVLTCIVDVMAELGVGIRDSAQSDISRLFQDPGFVASSFMGVEQALQYALGDPHYGYGTVRMKVKPIMLEEGVASARDRVITIAESTRQIRKWAEYIRKSDREMDQELTEEEAKELLEIRAHARSHRDSGFFTDSPSPSKATLSEEGLVAFAAGRVLQVASILFEVAAAPNKNGNVRDLSGYFGHVLTDRTSAQERLVYAGVRKDAISEMFGIDYRPIAELDMIMRHCVSSRLDEITLSSTFLILDVTSLAYLNASQLSMSITAMADLVSASVTSDRMIVHRVLAVLFTAMVEFHRSPGSDHAERLSALTRVFPEQLEALAEMEASEVLPQQATDEQLRMFSRHRVIQACHGAEAHRLSERCKARKDSWRCEDVFYALEKVRTKVTSSGFKGDSKKSESKKGAKPKGLPAAEPQASFASVVASSPSDGVEEMDHEAVFSVVGWTKDILGSKGVNSVSTGDLRRWNDKLVPEMERRGVKFASRGVFHDASKEPVVIFVSPGMERWRGSGRNLVAAVARFFERLYEDAERRGATFPVPDGISSSEQLPRSVPRLPHQLPQQNQPQAQNSFPSRPRSPQGQGPRRQGGNGGRGGWRSNGGRGGRGDSQNGAGPQSQSVNTLASESASSPDFTASLEASVQRALEAKMPAIVEAAVNAAAQSVAALNVASQQTMVVSAPPREQSFQESLEQLDLEPTVPFYPDAGSSFLCSGVGGSVSESDESGSVSSGSSYSSVCDSDGFVAVRRKRRKNRRKRLSSRPGDFL